MISRRHVLRYKYIQLRRCFVQTDSAQVDVSASALGFRYFPRLSPCLVCPLGCRVSICLIDCYRRCKICVYLRQSLTRHLQSDKISLCHPTLVGGFLARETAVASPYRPFIVIILIHPSIHSFIHSFIHSSIIQPPKKNHPRAQTTTLLCPCLRLGTVRLRLSYLQ